MDASAELESDIRLQGQSTILLAEFETSLPIYLWRVSRHRDEVGTQQHRIRSKVSRRETERLVGLLEPFQEWPQLLDPILARLLSPLVSAFVHSLSRGGIGREPKAEANVTAATLPLPQAICRLLYILCKVRGEKVITRFLNNEPKYLEPMILAFETLETPSEEIPDGTAIERVVMTWEQRYVMCLWISHLLLAPFDLESISSAEASIDREVPGFLGLPDGLPGVTIRLLRLSMRYMGVASKEREAATILLVRLALRPDMIKIGLLDYLVHWSLCTISLDSILSVAASIYQYIGLLSFLSRLLSSADPRTIAPYIVPIFQKAQVMSDEDEVSYRHVQSSALSRKLLIKIMRASAVYSMRSPRETDCGDDSSAILESVIDHLLRALADKDTPVRMVASKSLSVITVKMNQAMIKDVVDAVLGSLAEDVLWEDESTGLQLTQSDVEGTSHGFAKRNLTAVDPLRWHGLTLTLSHLLYRRSPPASQLADVLNSLVLALEFEQRASTGSSIGTNVRDAACFGIWALSRMYTTAELLAAEPSKILAARRFGSATSVPQILATSLVSAACLDPAGNIRRGASAALQELIGRHPNTIIEGIKLVQTVDYHSVALFSRAVAEVAVAASELHDTYCDTLFNGMLNWRGLGSSNAASRRIVASAVGSLSKICVGENRTYKAQGMLDSLSAVVRKTSCRQVEERHGILLSISAIVRIALSQAGQSANMSLDSWKIGSVLSLLQLFSASDLSSTVLRPELTAEATGQLISAGMQYLNWSKNYAEEPLHSPATEVQRLIEKSVELLTMALYRTENVAMTAASIACRELLSFLEPAEQRRTLNLWLSELKRANDRGMGAGARGLGFLRALAAVFPLFSPSPAVSYGTYTPHQLIIDTLLHFCASDIDVELRVEALHSLKSGVIRQKVLSDEIIITLLAALNDYTIDSRGDVGSWIRIEAIDAVLEASRQGLLANPPPDRVVVVEKLSGRVARLSAEKMDKVRGHAWVCLTELFHGPLIKSAIFIHPIEPCSVSDQEYFSRLLLLVPSNGPSIRIPLLEGYVSSAGAGSESILSVSRNSLGGFAHHLSPVPSEGQYSLSDLCIDIMDIIQQTQDNDRILVPALEVLAFLFDLGIVQSLIGSNFKWKALIFLVRKSHYQTGNIQKLEAAAKIYGGLADVHVTRKEALSRLANMLLHPYSRIRNSAADLLYSSTGFAELECVDWTLSATALKEIVGRIQDKITAEYDKH